MDKKYDSKKLLMALAKYGAPRPGHDPEFTKWLKGTKPHWFK